VRLVYDKRNKCELKKIKGQIYKGNLGFYKNTKDILGLLVKNSLNLNSFPPIPPNFGGNENLGLEGIGRNECSISFPSLKLLNKEKKRIFLKYSFFSIPFHSFPPFQTEC
jgi:hypothetical protein